MAAISDYMELPLMSETIRCVMLLHHALEFSTSPKAVLAEAGRVTMPGGHLVLCMFNPYGPYGPAEVSHAAVLEAALNTVSITCALGRAY